MKKTKKLLALVLCMAMAAMTFAACGSSKDLSGSQFCGKWVATKASMGDFDMEVSEIYADGFIMELKGDGSCQITADGESQTGHWDESEDGKEVILDGEADADLKIYMEDNVLKMDSLGVILSFEKQ